MFVCGEYARICHVVLYTTSTRLVRPHRNAFGCLRLRPTQTGLPSWQASLLRLELHRRLAKLASVCWCAQPPTTTTFISSSRLLADTTPVSPVHTFTRWEEDCLSASVVSNHLVNDPSPAVCRATHESWSWSLLSTEPIPCRSNFSYLSELCKSISIFNVQFYTKTAVLQANVCSCKLLKITQSYIKSEIIFTCNMSDYIISKVYKKAVPSKDDRAMRPIYGCPEISGLPDYAHDYYSQHFSWSFVPIDPMNVPTKFEVRSFTRSWDNRGYSKKLGSPWIRPRSLFSKTFNGLLCGLAL